MRCKACKAEFPFDIASAPDFTCLICNEPVYPTAEDYVTQPILGLAREVRPAQIALTKLIDQAFLHESSGIFEAGTGVGKSYAYLLAAVLSGKRAIVSTAKKSLQSQLYEKDLPTLAAALAKQKHVMIKYAIAYGKSNYVCRHQLPKSKAAQSVWNKFFDHGGPSKPGSTQGWWTWDEVANYAKTKAPATHLPVLKYSSEHTAEKCVGIAKCKVSSSCTYIAHKKEVAEADIVVTNHWLLGYHLRLQEEQDYKLLGPASVVIVDEAHKIEDGIRTAFTDSISEKMFEKLIKKFDEDVYKDGRQLVKEAPEFGLAVKSWGDLFDVSSKSAANVGDSVVQDFVTQSQDLHVQLRAVRNLLATPPFVEKLFNKQVANNTTNLLAAKSIPPGIAVGIGMASMTPDQQESWGTYAATHGRIQELIDILDNASDPETPKVTYIERDSRSGERTISISPIDVSPYLRKLHTETQVIGQVFNGPQHVGMEDKEVKTSVIYLSATLAVAGAFDVFAHRVGIAPKSSRLATGLFGSAFDLNKQATLYVPGHMPAPDRGEGVEVYRTALSEEIEALVTANQGNAFTLFTARDEMLDVAARLDRQFANAGIPLLVQDNISAADLLKQFRQVPNAVLFGLKSFWEGIDVVGDKLSLVIITKLPFPGRNDPIVNARRQKAGDLWFPHVDVPDMIFDLRQGIGRLIRSTTDTGVVAILDKRVLTKGYGKTVLRSSGFTSAQTKREAIVAGMVKRNSVP